MTDKQPDVLEVMARAIAAQNPNLCIGDEVKWRYCMQEARAALSAVLANMREPSEGMRQAPGKRGQLGPMGASEVWQAMLLKYRDENLGDNKGDTES